MCFSCYIWNINYVKILIKELKTLLPDTDIWLGGPEVSYDAEKVLEEFPELAGVMYGEGEKVFTNLCNYYGKCKKTRSYCERTLETEGYEERMDIPGITYHPSIKNPPELPINLSQLPFPYGERQQKEDGTVAIVPNSLFVELQNRIIYYESSRGCPFSCSYCLSSIDKTLRFRELSLVTEELQFFIDQKVPQVKFVDRTFNCNKKHALAIWNYILEHDNGTTNFHFEIGADLLDEEELEVLGKMRPGLVQLEIGVQSTHDATIKEVSRKMDLSALEHAVTTIRQFHNINLHLDLIAGLPFENLETFEKSFNDVYKMYADQLQLGFLKVLKGSGIGEKKQEYGLAHKAYAPYEVLFTKWLSYDDVLLLKGVEEMVENYYNSGQFTYTLKYLENYFETPFQFYYELNKYYEIHYDRLKKHARIDRYYILQNFFQEKYPKEDKRVFREMMTFDLYLRENMKTRPDFAAETSDRKKLFHEVTVYFDLKKQEHVELVSEETLNDLCRLGADFKIAEMESDDKPEKGKKIIYFDYEKRDPLNHNASVYEVRMI